MLGGPDAQWWQTAFFALGIPVLASLWSIRATARKDWHAYRTLVLAGFLLTPAFSYWKTWDDGAFSLQIQPVMLYLWAFLNFRGRVVAPEVAFASVFLSLLAADVGLAALNFASGPGASLDWMQGIGGGGAGDGLLVFPLAAAVLQSYARFRIKNAVATCYTNS